MAVTMNFSAGFVEISPTADPKGSAPYINNRSWGTKDTSPATAKKITEVGWWCDNATQAANYEVGLYSDDGTADPNLLLKVSRTNAKGTTAGWKKVTVDWTISANTVYWICVQVDPVATATRGNQANSGDGSGDSYLVSQTTLPTNWGTGTSTANRAYAIYALWNSTVDINFRANVSDDWKEVNEAKINIGDSWKDVTEAKVNIGDSWKTIF